MNQCLQRNFAERAAGSMFSKNPIALNLALPVGQKNLQTLTQEYPIMTMIVIM